MLLISAHSAADTFSVTSYYCDTVPGGYEWAIEQANATPGRDTISIDISRFSVDGCSHPDVRDDLPIAITESVDIVGNGNTVDGVTVWFDVNGILNPSGICPPTDSNWFSYGGALLDVGLRGTDASGIEVTVNNLNMTRLSTVGAVRKNAALTIEDSKLNNILSIYRSSCSVPIIRAEEGADLTLKNTEIIGASVPENGLPSTSFPLITALIVGQDGDLIMDNVTIGDSLGRHVAAVWWKGGAAKVVSSSFFDSNGFWLENTTLDFVNSIFQNYSFFEGQFSDNFILQNGSVLNSRASTFYWESIGCSNCNVTKSAGNQSTKGLGFIGYPSSNGLSSVRFESTALGSIDAPEPLQKLWGDQRVFSSDAYTWIQPTAGQDAAELATILPNASTALPGLTTQYNASYSAQIAPLVPGILVEAVPDASTGGVNELFNPIDGQAITVDINGRPRVYANGTRNIGAVQSIDAPSLGARPGDSQVSLTWAPTTAGQAQGYEICTSPTPLTDPVTGACPGTLTPAAASETREIINGLTNGAPYWFTIRVIGGVWSAVATATPMGPLGIAQPTAATIGDASVQVFWAEPASTGGYMGLLSYSVVFRPLGTQAWLFGPQSLTARTTLLPGLVNGTTYEIGIMAQTDDGGLSPAFGTITAAPQAAPTLSYAKSSNWPKDTPITLIPSIGQLQGVGAYTVESGALPDGLTLDPSSGVISGVPITVQSTSATIRLTDGLTGLFTSAMLPLGIVAPSLGPQSAYPEIQATVGVGPVSATPTQSAIPTGAIWSVYPGDSLPAGFALDSVTGVISGTPTTAPGRVLDITIQACWSGCDPSAGEVHLTPMLFFIVPSLQYPANTQATAGVLATVNPMVSLWSGGVFSIESGILPTGMNLDATTGIISGTPQTVDTSTFTIRYSTGVNVTTPPLEYVYSASQITVASPKITLSYPEVTGVIGENLSVSPNVSGVTDAAAYSSVSTTLPQGLSLNPTTGVITGVPSGPPGRYSIVLQVIDTYGSQRTSLVIDLKQVPSAFPIPTITGWGVIALTLLTVVTGLVSIRRRREVSQWLGGL